jgi:beta-lactamase regulating signal transducer with metallopeptidase domain
MTTLFPSPLWPAVANHLWQSTLFAVAAALLTLLLRKHSSRTRYWLWLAASLTFLVPFSLLVKLGTFLSWPQASVQSSTPALYSAMEEISQPFSPASVNVKLATPVHSIVSSGLPHISQVMTTLWLAGFFAVLILWTLRWFRITSVTRQAEPLSDGREVFALRRIERIFGLRISIGFLQSRASLEPGIFGILRPVLIWPEGISQYLNDSQLESVLAHELWHVRRRDNLFCRFAHACRSRLLVLPARVVDRYASHR